MKLRRFSEVVARSVIGAIFIPVVDSGQTYIHYVAKELMKQPSLKSDLVKRMACFEYLTLFVLARQQAIGCYRHLFRSFRSRVGERIEET